MSGLAKILLQQGYTVSGSDPVPNEETETLVSMGATFYDTQIAEHISADIDVVVVTAAIPADNAELMEAEGLGLTIMKRPELLNEIISKSKAIAVTGTHGKTTTSSMLSEALIAANFDPTVVVGAEIESIGSNSRLGKGNFSVAEVCEYQRAFLDIYPYAAVITNIDADHLDCYKDIDDIKAAFTKFVGQIDSAGFLVYCGDDANTQEVARRYQGKRISYGFSDNNDIVAENVVISENDSRFTVRGVGDFTISVPGKHNILNALACIAVAREIEADIEAVKGSLAVFRGAERRFQLKGVYQGAPVIDDYAHHPTELAAAISAARDRYPDRRIVIVFQPHQHSRTRLLKDDFVMALSAADLVIMPEIYTVRDSAEDIASISSRDIVDRLNKTTPGKAHYFADFAETVDFLFANTKEHDAILTVGAGPVYKIGDELVQK